MASKHIDIRKFSSLSAALNDTSYIFPENTFLIQDDKKWNYKHFNNLVNLCTNYLYDLGLKNGDIISILLRNSVDYLILYFSAIRGGIIVNPFPYHVSSEEVLSKIKIISPKLLFSHEKHYKTLKESIKNIKNIDNINNLSLIDHLLKFKSRYTKKKKHFSENTIGALYYSSGTTGKPKIVEYSNRSMIENQASMYEAGCFSHNAVHLCVLPLGHTAALNNSVFHCVLTGSCVIMYESFWKVRSELWDIVHKYKITYMVVVPTILITILNTPYDNFSKGKVKTISFIGCGSALLDKSLQSKFEKKFGIPVANLYGSSETGATHFDDPFRRNRETGNIGKLMNNVEGKIYKKGTFTNEEGQEGELCIKSPALLNGYYKDRQSYEDCFIDGFFKTGDIVYFDKNKIFYYVDRKKDLIIKGGVNILPSHIDEVLQSHPCILEAATVGKPDIFFGETIKSYIVLKNDEKITTQEILTFCKGKLGPFKTPSDIEFLNKLPKGISGKILKRELRKKDLKIE